MARREWLRREPGGRAVNAFEKAVTLIQQQAALRGGYPASINITLYRRRQFERLRPLEDYADHLRQREALIAWCDQRSIEVVELPVSGEPTARARARVAALPPYRLGLDIGRGEKTASIGWMMVELQDPRRKPEEGGEL